MRRGHPRHRPSGRPTVTIQAECASRRSRRSRRPTSASCRWRGCTTCGPRSRLRPPPARPRRRRRRRGGSWWCGTRRRCRRGAARTWARTRTRRLGVRDRSDHAARHRRRHVHHDALRPRGGAGPDDRQRDLGLPAPVRQSVGEGRRVLARRREDAAADRLRHGQRQALLAATRRPASPTTPSATTAVVDLNTPEILQGLPGNNGLSSPPIMYKQPRHHRRSHPGESAAGAGRRRARLGHPHRQAGLDVPFDSPSG